MDGIELCSLLRARIKPLLYSESNFYFGMIVQELNDYRADCKKCSNAVIKSLEIDGNRPLMLRAKWGGALVELGNSENQLIRDCKLYEPRSVKIVCAKVGKCGADSSEDGVRYILEREMISNVEEDLY